ncbi:DUF3046 domain-containing protein [Nocardioides litoris]|uniref:DUF3046 domain-containing protein n=1 Tax=Nocardioides litoris TaxID=1926648 RepID=UPI00111CD029|nr:DUF3046 domain-containing protein [Nocardioides litoris]
MRHTEFWQRMEQALGAAYARSWASSVVLADLDRRTAQQAIDEGVAPKQVWLAVWRQLELPDRDR